MNEDHKFNPAIVGLLIVSLVTNVILGFSFFRISKQPLHEDVRENNVKSNEQVSPVPSAVEKVNTVTLNFSKDFTLLLTQKSHIEDLGLIPSYDNGANRVNGVEYNKIIDFNLKGKVVSTGEVKDIPASVISIGRYDKSSTYDGLVTPNCTGMRCGYQFGSTNIVSQSQYVIIIKIDNQSKEKIIATTNPVVFDAAGKIFKEFSSETISIEPFEYALRSYSLYGPKDISEFSISY